MAGRTHLNRQAGPGAPGHSPAGLSGSRQVCRARSRSSELESSPDRLYGRKRCRSGAQWRPSIRLSSRCVRPGTYGDQGRISELGRIPAKQQKTPRTLGLVGSSLLQSRGGGGLWGGIVQCASCHCPIAKCAGGQLGPGVRGCTGPRLCVPAQSVYHSDASGRPGCDCRPAYGHISQSSLAFSLSWLADATSDHAL